MTTIAQHATAFEQGLRDTRRAGASHLPEPLRSRHRAMRPRLTDLVPAVHEGDAPPARTSLICSRFLRTTAPLLASDVLSLWLCGLVALLALHALGGAAAAQVG